MPGNIKPHGLTLNASSEAMLSVGFSCSLHEHETAKSRATVPLLYRSMLFRHASSTADDVVRIY